MLPDSLVQHYSSKTDDELLALAANPDSLVEEARPLLADELRRRNLDVQPIPTSFDSQKTRNLGSTVAKFSRTVGEFLLNLCIALFGTAMIESSIWSQIGHARSLSEVEIRSWFLNSTIAALLGFFVCRRWRTKSAMWVWILPAAFFAFRVLLYSTSRSNSLLVGSSLPQHFFAPKCVNDTAECRDFLIFTISAARTVAYSLAACVSWHFQRRQNRTEIRGT